MMRKYLWMVIVAVGLVNSVLADATNKQCERLYIARADQAQVLPQGDKVFLILNNVSPQIHYFCDRPVRESGNQSIQSFVDNWSVGKNNFRVDHPNAAIIADITGNDSKVKQSYNKDFILSHPKYDEKKQQLIFEIFGFEKNEKISSENIINPSVFIDDCSLC